MVKAKVKYPPLFYALLDSTRGEYERAMYGRKTTEELEVLETAPEHAEVGETGSMDNSPENLTENPTENNIDQASQENDNDIDR